METRGSRNRTCPKCGASYKGHPALSRTDGETPICPKCGTREALEAIGMGLDEIEEIVAAIPNFDDK